MATDPRMELVKGHQGSAMRTAQRLSAIERRLDSLERTSAACQVTGGQPTTAPRPGTLAVDSTHVYLWTYVNGGWHYTALT